MKETAERKNPKRKKLFIIIAAVLLAAVIAEFIRSNYVIDVEKITYRNSSIPDGFDGAVIVQISDYHNHGGRYDDRLTEKIKEQDPDYIFLTGDIADSILTDIDKANAFLEKVSEIAPCYLVWGNHDNDIEQQDKDSMIKCCEENGITVLDSETTYLRRGEDKILLVGTSDYLYSNKVDEMMKDYPAQDQFTIWLHHYPEDFHEIVDMSSQAGCQADLIFTGHAHGGLFGFPFPNGLYAPGQGFLPEYTSGEYTYNGSEMIVSRGVGNSGYTRRFADSFHLVVVTLRSPL